MDERGGDAGVPLPHAPPPPPHHHTGSSNDRNNSSSSNHHHHHMPGQHQHQHQYYASPHAQYASSPLPPIQQYQQSPHPPHHPPPPAHLVNHSHYGVPPSFYSPNGMPSAPMMPSNVGANGQHWPSPHASTSSGAKQNSPKEVKRRTKTGCLTCRKRRIKCDEGQPTCNNCRKSKRPCMGYDPVFKGTTLSPQLIQPAPPPAGPSIPSETFSQPPPPFQGSYLPSAASPLPPGRTSLDQPTLASSPYVPAMQSQRRVKPLSMDMLFAIQDVPPRFENRDQPATIPPHQQQAIFDFYNFHYGPALNHLFETNWYTSSAYQYIQQSPSLFNFIIHCSSCFENGADNVQAAQQNQSLETRLVWQLACVARTAARSSQDPLLVTVLNRLDIVERLLTGYFLEPQRIPPPPQNPQDKQNAFWHHLGRFVTARDDTNDPAAQKQVQDSLQAMRGTLEVVETRDVLYSIAICRHIGGRMSDFQPPRHILSSPNNDTNDDSHRLRVAYNFIEMEDQRGNSQVIQRICSMAIRGWILQKQP